MVEPEFNPEPMFLITVLYCLTNNISILPKGFVSILAKGAPKSLIIKLKLILEKLPLTACLQKKQNKTVTHSFINKHLTSNCLINGKER